MIPMTLFQRQKAVPLKMRKWTRHNAQDIIAGKTVIYGSNDYQVPT